MQNSACASHSDLYRVRKQIRSFASVVHNAYFRRFSERGQPLSELKAKLAVYFTAVYSVNAFIAEQVARRAKKNITHNPCTLSDFNIVGYSHACRQNCAISDFTVSRNNATVRYNTTVSYRNALTEYAVINNAAADADPFKKYTAFYFCVFTYGTVYSEYAFIVRKTHITVIKITKTANIAPKTFCFLSVNRDAFFHHQRKKISAEIKKHIIGNHLDNALT